MSNGSSMIMQYDNSNTDNDRQHLIKEKHVVASVLKRLFSDMMANSLFNSIYTDAVEAPVFSNQAAAANVNFIGNNMGGGAGGKAAAAGNYMEPANAWCRFDVKNFCLNHFAKDPFPEFTVTMAQLNGDPLPRAVQDGKPVTMTDMRIRISVYNKWADVSSEVLPDTEFVRVLKDGWLTVSDLMFRDVSFKHGGYFIMRITPLDFKGEIMSWKSPKFQIQSVKTHCVKKRKAAAASHPIAPKPASQSSPPAHTTPVQQTIDANSTEAAPQKRPAFLSNQSTLQESLNIFSNPPANEVS